MVRLDLVKIDRCIDEMKVRLINERFRDNKKFCGSNYVKYLLVLADDAILRMALSNVEITYNNIIM